MREETLVVGARHMGAWTLKDCLELTLEAPLIPVRERNNPHDSNAVLLLNLYGKPVGYVQRAVARIVASAMDGGEVVFAKVIRAPNLKNGRVRMQLRYPRALLWSDEPPSEVATKKIMSLIDGPIRILEKVK